MYIWWALIWWFKSTDWWTFSLVNYVVELVLLAMLLLLVPGPQLCHIYYTLYCNGAGFFFSLHCIGLFKCVLLCIIIAVVTTEISDEKIFTLLIVKLSLTQNIYTHMDTYVIKQWITAFSALLSHQNWSEMLEFCNYDGSDHCDM